MPEQMQSFLILLSAIGIVLVLIVVLCSSKSKVRKSISMFLKDKEERAKIENRNQPKQQGRENNSSVQNNQRGNVNTAEPQRRTSQPQIEMATLIRKSDDRRRIIESTGQTHYEDEFFELIFKTRKGRTVILECSKNAYETVPFNQQGSLTYKKEKLVKFKYFGGIVLNDEK